MLTASRHTTSTAPISILPCNHICKEPCACPKCKQYKRTAKTARRPRAFLLERRRLFFSGPHISQRVPGWNNGVSMNEMQTSNRLRKSCVHLFWKNDSFRAFASPRRTDNENRSPTHFVIDHSWALGNVLSFLYIFTEGDDACTLKCYGVDRSKVC